MALKSLLTSVKFFSLTLDPGLIVYTGMHVFPILCLFISRYFKLSYSLHTKKSADLKSTAYWIKEHIFYFRCYLNTGMSTGSFIIN